MVEEEEEEVVVVLVVVWCDWRMSRGEEEEEREEGKTLIVFHSRDSVNTAESLAGRGHNCE